MAAVKVTAADKWFSMCIRHRAGWCCQRCGKHYPEGPGRAGLHCSHFFGRGSWSIRFNIKNAFSHCYGCHQHLSSNPVKFNQWVDTEIGHDSVDSLTRLKHDSSLGRSNRKLVKEISKHYRSELRRMEAEGTTDLVGW